MGTQQVLINIIFTWKFFLDLSAAPELYFDAL